MQNFAELITPEKAFEINKEGDPTHTLEDYLDAAAVRGICQCGEPVWRYAMQDLCFSCTTGESDASEDYELFYTPRRKK